MDQKPLKYLIRDTILVYLSVVLGEIVFHQFLYPEQLKVSTPIFTGSPDF